MSLIKTPDYRKGDAMMHKKQNCDASASSSNDLLCADDDMKLPAGKTCADCYHCLRCTALFGAKKENTSCDFSPSKFVEVST